MTDGFPQRLQRRAIYENDWVCLYADTVRLPSGRTVSPYHQLHFPHASVAVVMADDRGELLLIRSKRYTTGREEWEVPAGRVETGETPEDAARRECREETGCEVEQPHLLCSQNPSNGMSDLLVHVYYARVHGQSDAWDTDEVTDRHWLPEAEVLAMLRRNEIHCGISMLALLYALRFHP